MSLVDRFERPPGIANGGFAIGTLACAVARAGEGAPYRITGRLNAPVPLHEDLIAVVERHGDGQWVASLNASERELISGTVDLGPAGHETWAELPEDLDAAVTRMHSHVHDRPTGRTLRQFMDPSGMGMPDDKCFGCGRAVENGGLYLLGRAVAEDMILSDLAGAPEYEDADGRFPVAVAAAATDCGTGRCWNAIGREFLAALRNDGNVMFTGTLEYHFLRPMPPSGQEYRVLATQFGRDGRKYYGVSAFDTSGVPYLVSKGTWIVVPNAYLGDGS